jgi:hypothetical protein
MFKATVILLSFCSVALADSSSLNLQMPNSSSSYQSDKFRAGDLDCSNAIGGATNVEFGVMSVLDNVVSPFGSEDPENPMSKDVGIYARIVIPLDAPKERINCNTLYQLELSKKRIEVLRLQRELDQLRQLQPRGFEN